MNQNYNNLQNQQLNVPNLVSNIENNIDTFGNSNMNTYVPIKNENLTYNPNIENLNSSQSGTMNNMQQNPMNNMQQNHMNNMQQIPMNNMQQNHMNNMQQIPMNNMQQMAMNNMQQINSKNNIVNTIETLENTKPGWFSNKGKKIKQFLIYAILFIIFSHSKMNEILCSKIPFLDSFYSNIPCITLKGCLISIVIMLINYLLNF